MKLTYKKFNAEVFYIPGSRSYYGDASLIEPDTQDVLFSFQATKRSDLQQAMQLAVDQFLSQVAHAVDI